MDMDQRFDDEVSIYLRHMQIRLLHQVQQNNSSRSVLYDKVRIYSANEQKLKDIRDAEKHLLRCANNKRVGEVCVFVCIYMCVCVFALCVSVCV